MAIWVIPVIIIGAVIAGLLVGLIVGKSQLKRSRPGYKPLLSRKERIIYSALFLGGTALILLGAFYKFPSKDSGADNMVAFDQPPAEVAMEQAAR